MLSRKKELQEKKLYLVLGCKIFGNLVKKAAWEQSIESGEHSS